MKAGRIPPGRRRRGRHAPLARSIAASRTRSAGGSSSRSGPTPTDRARAVVVEPIANEAALRNRDWVEANLRKVRDRTQAAGSPTSTCPTPPSSATRTSSGTSSRRSDKDAIIVDERFNGGGSVADYYIDLLRRPVVSYWAMRHGDPIRTPGAAILGPKVMLIDETAGSGGDLLPWMFRRFKLGTLVGRRTWGGLVGILGFPALIDGGRVTAPDLAFYTEDGWRVENEGVAARRRGRAVARRRRRGQGPPARQGDRDRPEGTRGQPPEAPTPSRAPCARA